MSLNPSPLAENLDFGSLAVGRGARTSFAKKEKEQKLSVLITRL